ncbi:MAG: sensor histidine kinase [Alkalispirochaeta sp.]
MPLLVKTDSQLNLLYRAGSDQARPVDGSLRDLIHPDDAPSVESTIRNGVRAGEDVVALDPCRLLEGSESRACTAAVSLFYDADGEFVGAALMLTESDSLSAAGVGQESEVRKLQQRLQHQDALLREVQHRVKNDMSFVHSLLSLQANSAGNSMAKSALLEAADRVLAVGTVYSRLHQHHEVEAVDGQGLVNDLINGLGTGSIPPSVRLTVECEKFTLPRRAAVSLGLIVNELVTNAAKYAVHESEDAEIRVAVSNHEGYAIRITVRDHGPGFPDHIRRGEGFGYGFTIIEALVEQDDGALRVWNDGGAVAEVRLPIGMED